MADAVMKRDRRRVAAYEFPARGSQVNIGAGERWLSLVAGGVLALYGLRRRAASRGAAEAAGAALLYRGLTGHCHVYQALGIMRAPRFLEPVSADRRSDTRQQLGGPAGVHVDEAVTINRPVADVFRFWRNFENLPTFMEHLESVSQREGGISHWVAKGPAGRPAEWDARIINEIENKLIGWQSLEGSSISTAGSVNFRETPRGTEVRVRLQYNPPAGKLGAAVAWLFGEEPSTQIREDLRRFKRLFEAGEVPTTEGQPRGGRR